MLIMYSGNVRLQMVVSIEDLDGKLFKNVSS